VVNVGRHHGVQGGRIERRRARCNKRCLRCAWGFSLLEYQTHALIDQLQKDMVAAMKAKEEARLSALRMIKAALMKLKVDSPKPLDEAAEMQVLKQLIKQRIDAAEMFRKGGRPNRRSKKRPKKRSSRATCRPAPAKPRSTPPSPKAMAETGATLHQTDGPGDESGAGGSLIVWKAAECEARRVADAGERRILIAQDKRRSQYVVQVAQRGDDGVKNHGVLLLFQHIREQHEGFITEQEFMLRYGSASKLAQDAGGSRSLERIVGRTPRRGVFEDLPAAIHTQCVDGIPCILRFVIAGDRPRKECLNFCGGHDSLTFSISVLGRDHGRVGRSSRSTFVRPVSAEVDSK
jgi:uncharacterized protein